MKKNTRKNFFGTADRTPGQNFIEALTGADTTVGIPPEKLPQAVEIMKKVLEPDEVDIFVNGFGFFGERVPQKKMAEARGIDPKTFSKMMPKIRDKLKNYPIKTQLQQLEPTLSQLFETAAKTKETSMVNPDENLITELQDVRDQLETCLNEKKQLENELRLQHEAEDARGRAQHAEDQPAQAKQSKKKKQLKRQVADLTEQNKKLVKRNVALTRQNEQLTEQNTNLTQQAAHLNEQITTLTQQVADLNEQIATLTQQATDLTHQNDQLTAQTTELSQQNDQLTEKVAHAEARAEAVKEAFNLSVESFEESFSRSLEATKQIFVASITGAEINVHKSSGEKPFGDLDFPEEVLKALERAGIRNLDTLCKMSDNKLRKLVGGGNVIATIQRELKKGGLALCTV